MQPTRTALPRNWSPLRFLLPLALLVAAALPAFAGPDPAVEAARNLGRAFTKVAHAATPAVVFIKVERAVKQGQATPYNDPFNLFNDEFFERFFHHRMPEHRAPTPNRKPKYVQYGQGSGFLIGSDGIILTNHHVVGDADRIDVRLRDGREFPAKLVGTDPKSDVAVIRIQAKGLPYLDLGDSDKIEVGEWVVAVGNPFGLAETVTSGIISAKGRSRMGISDYEDFIQTDAAINPGNSGGPLLDLDGKVIGINSAIYTRSGGYMGIGFAIPINLARGIEQQLLHGGKVERGYLGVLVQDLTPELAQSLGVNAEKGALIGSVTKGSPSAAAGLEAGDVIVGLDGKPVEDSNTLRNDIGMLRPGTTVKLAVLRDGKQLTVPVTIGSLSKAEAQSQATGEQAPSKQAQALGLAVAPLSSDFAAQHGYARDAGVVVSKVEPGSVAAMAGIRPGNLIVSVNRTRVKSPADFDKALQQGAKSGRVLFRLREGDQGWYVVLSLR